MIIATALAAAVMLVPAAAQARSGHHNKANSADRNRDRIPDRWERRHHLSLKVKQAKRDQDRDGLNNMGEFKRGTNPRDADSDDDGVKDGPECKHGLNPRKDDSDDDGVEDRDENAGKVASFDASTGVLTIELAKGGTVSGVVNNDTELRCERASTTPTTPTAQAAHDDGDDDHSGSGDREDDHSGPGDGEHGDDHGDDEDEHHNDANCTTADLTAGTLVHEAELKVTSSGAVFHEVKLIK